MTLGISYSDSISYPWPSGSTFDCWRKGNSITTSTPCQNAPSGQPTQFQFDAGCSAPAWPLQKSASWQCTYDISKLPGFSDGKWYYCVREADYAIPDNSSDQNQYAATSDKANLSPDTPANCGYITLDRGAPTLTPHSSARQV